MLSHPDPPNRRIFLGAGRSPVTGPDLPFYNGNWMNGKSGVTPLKASCWNQILTDIFICEHVRKTHTLGLMLDRLAVHNGVFEILDDRLMDRMTLPPC
jgi:hypothetical protein